MSTMLPTIIIPAHNEAKVIEKTLSSLEEGVNKFYNIIVVCNGCNDNTSDIASSFKNIQCKSIETASKIEAIRHAESLNPNFPRLYLDADILLTTSDAHLIFLSMKNDLNAGLYLPKSKTNTNSSHFTVKSYYKAWYDTPFVKQLGYGSGIYALTKKGRERFLEWPNLISDDGFIRSYFRKGEVHIVENVCVEVQAPKTWWQLIRIKTRSKYGILELKQHLQNERRKLNNPVITSETPKRFSTEQLGLKLNYFAINLIAITWAYWMLNTQNFSWMRDKSNH